MSSQNQKSAGRLLYPIEGGKLPARDIITLEGNRDLIDFDDDDLINKRALKSYNPAAAVLDVLVEVGDPDIYTLSAGDLLILNTYARYPNFVAIINGTQFNDIVPTYVGAIGDFTACTVPLHSDGAGNNAEETLIQFS